MTSHRILGLASAANEAVIAYHEACQHSSLLFEGLAAVDLVEAVDALTGAIAEEANQNPHYPQDRHGVLVCACGWIPHDWNNQDVELEQHITNNPPGVDGANHDGGAS